MNQDLTYFRVGTNFIKFDEIRWYEWDRSFVLGVKGGFFFLVPPPYDGLTERFSVKRYMSDRNYRFGEPFAVKARTVDGLKEIIIERNEEKQGT